MSVKFKRENEIHQELFTKLQTSLNFIRHVFHTLMNALPPVNALYQYSTNEDISYDEIFTRIIEVYDLPEAIDLLLGVSESILLFFIFFHEIYCVNNDDYMSCMIMIHFQCSFYKH